MTGARASALVLSALVLVTGQVRADTLVGRNGERLAGQLIEEKDGTIVFMSDLVGRVEVSSDKAHVETTAAQVVEAPAAPAAAEPAEVKWRLDVGAKLALDRGSLKTHEDRLGASIALLRKTERGELHGDASYKYKRTDGDLRDDDWHVSLGYDQFLSERSYRSLRVLADTELTSADEHDDTLALTATIGWRLWETPSHFLRFGPTLGYLTAGRGGESFDGAVFGAHARALAPLPGGASLSAELQYLDAFGDGRYANLQMRVRRPLGDRLFVALAWRYDWSDFALESGITSEWRWEVGWRLGQE